MHNFLKETKTRRIQQMEENAIPNVMSKVEEGRMRKEYAVTKVKGLPVVDQVLLNECEGVLIGKE